MYITKQHQSKPNVQRNNLVGKVEIQHSTGHAIKSQQIHTAGGTVNVTAIVHQMHE